MLTILKTRKILGYTLIELMVVIVIIGILTAIALVAYQGVRKSARDTRRKADLEAIRSALEMYKSDQGKYPSTLGASGLTTYLVRVPKDPLDPTYTYTYLPVENPIGSGFYSSYTLCSTLENGVETSNCPVGCSGNYRTCSP